MPVTSLADSTFRVVKSVSPQAEKKSAPTLFVLTHDEESAWIMALMASDLTLAPIKVGILLAQHLNHTSGKCNPGAHTLAKEGNMDVRSVRRALQILIKGGWIAIIRKGGQSGKDKASSQYGLIHRRTHESSIDDQWVTGESAMGDSWVREKGPVSHPNLEKNLEKNKPAPPLSNGKIFVSAKTPEGYIDPLWGACKAIHRQRTGRVLSPREYDAGYGEWIDAATLAEAERRVT